MIKHDYTTFDLFGRWGFQMGTELTSGNWTFRDRSRTTAEVVLNLYEAIRDGCGRDGFLIGCNTLSHLSAGCFEYCRVGDDSGNNLERAMKYGPNPFAFRLPQHRAFYVVDPDCVGNLKDIPWKYNRQFLNWWARAGRSSNFRPGSGALTTNSARRSARPAGGWRTRRRAAWSRSTGCGGPFPRNGGSATRSRGWIGT